jgi:hypothetical protein
MNLLLFLIFFAHEFIPIMIVIITLVFGIVINMNIIIKHFNNKKNVGTQTGKMSISFITTN